MKKNYPLKNIVVILIIVSLININFGCVAYKTTILPKDQPMFADTNKEYFVYQRNTFRIMKNITIEKDRLIGALIVPPPNFKTKKKQRVNLYLNNTFEIDWDEYAKTGTTAIPFSAIEKVDVYDMDVGKTILYTAGGLAGTAGAIFLVILLLKESCPFVYAYNGESYEFTGEIYSGAIHPPLERHDYLPLPGLSPINNEYKIKITNEVKEIQHTNLAELIVFDHPENTDILIDKYGTAHRIVDPRPPHHATTIRGDDVESLLINKDDVNYLSGIPEDNDELMDGVILTFDRPKEAKNGKLLIRGKNTFWLDYIHGQFSELFGNKLGDWKEKQKTRSFEELMNWSLNQGIPLSVFLETDKGWEFVDYFNVIGPMAAKEDVLSIDLSKMTSDEVRIKLEFGFLFWEIDYAAMEFTPDFPAQQTRLQVVSAKDQNGRDVSDLLQLDDDYYYDQPYVDDEVLLAFEVPPKKEGIERTAILHSKGHYEILRNPTGKPDLVYLKGFRESGAFPQFSKERFFQLYNGLQE